MINRHSLITGLISFVAAPAIVRVESLMKLPRPEKVLSDEEIQKILDRLWANNYGKLFHIPNRAFMIMTDRIVSIPDSEHYA